MKKQSSLLRSPLIHKSLAAAVLLALTSGAIAQDSRDGDRGGPGDRRGEQRDQRGDRPGDRQSSEQVETLTVTGQGSTNRDLTTLRGPVIDIPQLVSTISADTLIDRQVNTLDEALRNVAGITTAIGEGGVVNGDQFFIRGQSAKNDIFTDGLRDFGAFTRDSFNFEQIAVLKGPSSTALGRGVSGGAINSGSKLAGNDNSYVINAGAGTDHYRRATLDANIPLSSNVGFRLNLMAHQNDAVDRDVINSERFGIAPSLNFELSPSTSLNLIGFHQQEDRIPDYGVPVVGTSAVDDIELPVTELGVPRTNFYGYVNGDEDDVKVTTLTALLRHEVSSDLRISSDTKYGVYDRYFRQTVAGCTTSATNTCGDFFVDNNPATVPLATMGGPGPYDQTTKGVQNVTTALFTAPIGDMRNEFVIGWDVSIQQNDRAQLNYAGTRAPKDLFNPAHTPAPALAAGFNNVRDTEGKDYSLIVDDRLWLHPEFSVDVGVRFQKYVNEQVQTNVNVTTCNGVTGTYATCDVYAESVNELVNPKVAGIWEPSDAVSIYLSWSESSVPPGNSVGNGDALSAPGTGNVISTSNLDPETSEIIDLGVKLAFFDDKLLLQSGVYQIDRDNAQEIDPQSGNTISSPEPAQTLRGAELGVSGAISDSLLLTANYSYTDAEIDSTDVTTNGRQMRFVPKRSASAWATWQPLQGSLQGLEVGTGLSHQSEVFLNLQNTQVTPSYTSFDALVSYRFSNMRVALNAYNLTDEEYYSQVNGGRVVPAAGRSFIASLNYSF